MVHIRHRYKRLRRPNPPGSVRAASCSQAEEPLLRLSQNIQPRQHQLLDATDQATLWLRLHETYSPC